MTDITRRDLLKSGAVLPLLPVLVGTTKEFSEQNRELKSNESIVYKFTTLELKSFIDIFQFTGCGVKEKYTLQYELNKEIYPKFGKLFAFSELNSMKKWADECVKRDNNIKLRFFKCVAKNVITTYYQCGIDLHDMDYYWEKFNATNCIESFQKEQNVVLCDSIKLIEELHD